MTTHDTLALSSGNRARLRNRTVVLVGVAAVAIAVLIGALHQKKGDDNGSVGHLVVPAAVAIVCLAASFVSLSQWWEDATFLRLDGDRVAVSHGVRGRGHAVWLECSTPVVVTREGSQSSTAVFLTQGEVRARLGDVDVERLEAWLRLNGVSTRRR